MYTLALILLCVISYLLVAFCVWLASLITPLVFSWGVSFIVWLIIVIIKGVL